MAPPVFFPRRHRLWLGALVFLVLGAAAPLEAGGGAAAGAVEARPAPEAATGRVHRALGTAAHGMVAAANPLAAEAGREILRAGGSAADAAIAMQLVLGLVEPQSSGLGGGAFLLHYDAVTRAVTAFDGRETAPAAARPDRFLDAGGRPLAFHAAVVGGRSVGVPGTVRLLETVHRRHGRLPWARLFARAIALAEEGFAISPRLHGLLAGDRYLRGTPAAAALYYQADGAPKPVGAVLANPDLAATLRLIAAHGASAFYEGPLAADIARVVTAHPTNPGDMTTADLAGYRVRERPAVCRPYRVHVVCGMGAFSSGAVAVAQTLGVLETRDMAALRADPPAAVHWISEAERLAFADRARYVADPDFVAAPLKGLLDPGYLRARAVLIDPARSMGTAAPGDPPDRDSHGWAPAAEQVEHGTSHLIAIDADGNAVSMTTTIEDQFGSRQMTHGFLLNNELTDFSFRPEEDGRPVANRVEPGKRPRSSMAPTLILDAQGRLAGAVGSAGGSFIIDYVVKTLVAMLDWGLDPQAAADFPNFGSRNGPTELERGTAAEAWAPALRTLGHEVALLAMTSGTQAVIVTPDGLEGGADSRREGVAVGD